MQGPRGLLCLDCPLCGPAPLLRGGGEAHQEVTLETALHCRDGLGLGFRSIPITSKHILCLHHEAL